MVAGVNDAVGRIGSNVTTSCLLPLEVVTPLQISGCCVWGATIPCTIAEDAL